MRIIAGKLGGRTFEAPKGHKTHPMSDKMRGAIFGTLGDIEGLTVLDAFAGSGALAIESISRGASSAIAIDSDKNAYQSMKNNLKSLDLENVKVTQANVSSWSGNNPDRKFDLVFCDPPYDKLQLDTLQKLTNHLKTGGIYVLSWPGNLEMPKFKFMDRVKTKSHGDGQLAFYRKL